MQRGAARDLGDLRRDGISGIWVLFFEKGGGVRMYTVRVWGLRFRPPKTLNPETLESWGLGFCLKLPVMVAQGGGLGMSRFQ